MPDKPIKMFKAFNENFQCRGFQYEVGKTYKHDGVVEVCGSGFHACSDPWAVLNYYPITSRFAVVEMSDIVRTQGDKSSTNVLSIVEEQNLDQYIKHCQDYITTDKIGVYAESNLAASGDESKLAASGDGSNLAASGKWSNLAASGYRSNLATSGKWSNLAASGYRSNLAASGDGSNLAASGYRSNLAASGKNSVCISAGSNSKAKTGENGSVILTYWCEDSERYRHVIGYTGEDGIKPHTWYKICNGKLVETTGD